MKHKIALLALLVITVGVRSLHLLSNNAAIVNPDSWYYHLISKGDVSWYQTGLAPFLRHTGEIGIYALPLLIALGTAILIYLLASRLFDKSTGLLSVAFFALFSPAYIIGLVGNVDRDGLTLFLTLLAITVYYFSKTWKGALWVAAISGLIFLEWMWVGVLIVAGIIIVTTIAEYWQNKRFERPQVLWTLGGLAIAVVPFLIPQALANLDWLLTDYRVSEMTPITIVYFWPYFLLMPFPIVFGAKWLYYHRGATESATEYSTVKGLTFLFAWCAACCIMGLAASRLAQFLIPAACIIAGFGFGLMLKDKMLRPDKKQAVIAFSIGMLLLSASFAAKPPDNMLMPNSWVDAMHYMRDNTPENAKVMSWWDNGYWISDVGERASLTDGGHAADTNTHHFVGLVYCTDNDRYAAQIMQEYETQYLVMSTRELNYFKTIEKNAGQSGDGGLYERSSSWDFESAYFEEIYRSQDVWILRVRCVTCGG